MDFLGEIPSMLSVHVLVANSLYSKCLGNENDGIVKGAQCIED